MSTIAPALVLDVQEIPPRDRHALIFGRFDALQPGQALQLVNDHDPLPLYRQFEARSAGRFEWTYLEAGPVRWRVQIAKTGPGAGQAAGDACCSGGGCS